MADLTGAAALAPLHEEMARLALAADLCRIYAQDDSETANLTAIEAVKGSFGAAAAALFYVSGSKEFRVCLAGSDFPIALPEARWRACVEHRTGAVVRFGPWSLPGIEQAMPEWISACLYAETDQGGYVFLGRESGEWTAAHSSALDFIRAAIAPIVAVRHQRDVEELRRRESERQLAANERRLRDLFEGSRDMIYTADAADVITGCNRSAPVLLGRADKDAVIGRPFAEFALNPSDRAPFLAKLAADGYVDDYEIILTKPDGSALFCLETAHAVRDASGAVRELHGIVKDITQRIESERDLWRTNLELADANLKLQRTQSMMVQHEKLASIGQLAAGVAHEINNPLGFLISNHRMLEKYFSKNRAAWDAAVAVLGPAYGKIESDAGLAAMFGECEAIFAESDDGFERIRTIVSHLKDFSRVDRSGEFAPYDVNAGIESTLVVAWNEIKYVAEIRKDFGVLPPIMALGNEVNQVFLNILVNAAQAIGGQRRAEKGLIGIETRTAGDSVEIAFRDDGPGIPETVRNKIFDPFFTTKEPGKGTGLGLSISYDIIVAKHGGRIWVESEPGKGSVFRVALPLAGPSPAKP